MDALPTPLHLGLTGYPLGHSLSPRLQAAALQAAGLAGEYRLYPVPPLPDGWTGLQELLARLRLGVLHGLNVTIPHKGAVLPLLDELTPVARAAGAVNTLFVQAGRLVGDNTDVGGFLADLQAVMGLTLPGVPGGQTPAQPAIVLGAGGSARAVVYGLAQAGWQVSVAARRLEQAQALAGALLPALADGQPAIQAIPLTTAALARLPAPPALIVNTTPLGMLSQAGACAWPEGTPFPPGARLYDLVYNPPETPLLRAARRAGLPAWNGLGMLVEQAALAFERWTGRPADRPAMRAAVAD